MAALRQDARNVRKQTLFLEKHKNVTTKSFYITSDGFIQTFRFYLIHLSQVKVKHHFLPPDGVDLTLHQSQQIFFLDIVLHNLKFKSYTKLWCKDSANPLWPKGKTYTPASVGVFLYHRTPAICIKLDKFWRVLPDLSMMGRRVYTRRERICDISWMKRKTAVTLHQI